MGYRYTAITFSKELLEKYSETYYEKYKKYCDYEYLLSIRIPDFKELPEEFREKAIQAVTKMEAHKVADKAKNDLLKKKHTINEVIKNQGGLGYTTWTQEITAWREMNEEFYFSCYMLAKFKEKYGMA